MRKDQAPCLLKLLPRRWKMVRFLKSHWFLICFLIILVNVCIQKYLLCRKTDRKQIFVIMIKFLDFVKILVSLSLILLMKINFNGAFVCNMCELFA